MKGRQGIEGVAMNEREGDGTEAEDLDEVEEWFSL